METELELRLKRLHDVIEADADRAQATLQNSGQPVITPQMLKVFVRTVRQRIQTEMEVIATAAYTLAQCVRSIPAKSGHGIIDHHFGHKVTGTVQGGSVSWQLGRQRNLSIGS